jgi:hypothetical protein
MYRKIIMLVFVFFVIASTGKVLAQMNMENDTRTLQILSIDCNYAKGKVLGETVRLDAIIDGFDIPMDEKTKLKTGETWNINANFDFIDFALIKVWKDNVFSDKLIGELRVDSSMLDRMNTVEMTHDKVVLRITYRVVPGPGYKNMILMLRGALAQASKEIKYLVKENKRLKSEVSRLENRNDDLEDKIYKDKKK